MKEFFRKVNFYIARFFFEKMAIPQVRNEHISKVILKKYLPNNPVIIDCGAHDGSDSLQFAQLFRKGTIHSFEPVEELFNRLLKNTKSLGNITCYQIALADRDGKMDFYVSQGASDGSSSLMEPKDHLTSYPDTSFSAEISVNTVTLDSWAVQYGIPKVDMLWLDMQGFEYNMLIASKIILQKVLLIHTEVSLRETYKDVAQYNVLRSFLEEKGFRVLMEAIPKNGAMGNVLFAKNR